MCTEMVASASSLRCAAAAPIGPGTEGAARVLCAIGAVASASVAVNAADLQLHLTELVAALIRPALACSRLAVAPQCRQRCALRT